MLTLSSQKVLPSAPDNVKFFAEIFSEIEGSCGYFATFSIQNGSEKLIAWTFININRTIPYMFKEFFSWFLPKTPVP